MSVGNKKLLSWIKKQFYVRRKEGRCIRLQLHHMGATSKIGAELERINPGEGLSDGEVINDSLIEDYASEIWASAENYAEGIGDTQTFVVVAYFQENEDKGMTRFPFVVRVDNEDLEGGSALSSEPANLTGSLKQQMRHNEAIMRHTMGFFGTALGTLQRQNERLSTMVEKLFDEKVQQIEAIEELTSASHQRQIELKREESSLLHKSQMVEGAMALLPAVANKFIGRKILPETVDPSLMQVVKLAEALSEDEMVAILNAIQSPEKKIAFVELLQSVKHRTEIDNGNAS